MENGDGLGRPDGVERSTVVPDMPLARPHELRHGDPYILGGSKRHLIGWQRLSTRNGDPVFGVYVANFLGLFRIVESFPLTKDGWSRAWRALLAVDAGAARQALVELAKRAPGDRLEEGTLDCMANTVYLGGYTKEAVLAVGTFYDVRFLEDRLLVLPHRRVDVLVEVPYAEIRAVTFEDAGLAGPNGALAVPDWPAHIEPRTIVRVQGVNCELFMLHSKTPRELQIDLSRSLSAIRRAQIGPAETEKEKTAHGRLPGAPTSIMRAGTVEIPLHGTIIAALRFTASRSQGRPIDTHCLLVSLMKADSAGEWHRIWLHCGDVDAIEANHVQDVALEPLGSWEDVQLTCACARALDVSRRLSERYNMKPVPVGLLALGLIADETSGAARVLGAGLGRTDLVRLIQDAILGRTLQGLDTVMPEVLADTRNTSADGMAVASSIGDVQPVLSPPPPVGAPVVWRPDATGQELIRYLENRQRRRWRLFKGCMLSIAAWFIAIVVIVTIQYSTHH